MTEETEAELRALGRRVTPYSGGSMLIGWDLADRVVAAVNGMANSAPADLRELADKITRARRTRRAAQ